MNPAVLPHPPSAPGEMHRETVIPDEGRRALLRRAAELQAAGQHAIADVRAAAGEAGLAPEYVDAALAELVTRGARDLVPLPRWRRWGGGALTGFGLGFLVLFAGLEGSPASFIVTMTCLGSAALGLSLRRGADG